MLRHLWDIKPYAIFLVSMALSGCSANQTDDVQPPPPASSELSDYSEKLDSPSSKPKYTLYAALNLETDGAFSALSMSPNRYELLAEEREATYASDPNKYYEDRMQPLHELNEEFVVFVKDNEHRRPMWSPFIPGEVVFITGLDCLSVLTHAKRLDLISENEFQRASKSHITEMTQTNFDRLQSFTETEIYTLHIILNELTETKFTESSLQTEYSALLQSCVAYTESQSIGINITPPD